MIRPCYYLLLLCLLGTGIVAAQNPKKKNKDVEVIDFGSDPESDTEKKTYNGMIIKTSPTAFIFGLQPLEFEKEFSDLFSLQVGGGITFLPVWSGYQELLSEINEDGGYCDSPQWSYDECDYYSDYTIRKGKIGPMFSVSGRLFFDNDGYEGMYIAPVLRYSLQKYQVQRIVGSSNELVRVLDDWQDEQERNIDMMVHYGGQTLYPSLTVEWFLGGGLRFNHSNRQDIGLDASGYYQNGEREFSQTKLRLELGLRVGFQL